VDRKGTGGMSRKRGKSQGSGKKNVYLRGRERTASRPKGTSSEYMRYFKKETWGEK